jgi:hypothetical protein
MISVLVPTRKRVPTFRRMAESIRGTASTPVEIVTYVDEDEDDESLEQILDIAEVMIEGPRLTFSNYWNVLARAAHGDILMMCGDDTIFRTPGWDKIVTEAFDACPDKILMVHGDDGSPADLTHFATLPFVSRRWVEVAGRMTGEWFEGDFADTWINDIAKDLGRSQHVPILIEHMHPYWSKGEMDENYREKFARMAKQDAARVYLQHFNDRFDDREKLRAAMDATWLIPEMAQSA